MGRETCEAVELHLLIERAHAIIRGLPDNTRIRLGEHFSPRQMELLRGHEGDVFGVEIPAGEVWRAKVEPHCVVYDISGGGRGVTHAILCRHCFGLSYAVQDALHLYCARCKAFHRDRDLARFAAATPGQMLALLDACVEVDPRTDGPEYQPLDPRKHYVKAPPPPPELDLPADPPEPDTIESLLMRHPQTVRLESFAADVARHMRGAIE